MRAPFKYLLADLTASCGLPAPGLLGLFEAFLQWRPISPASARELANVGARRCRQLRDQVAEELQRKGEALTSLAADWRKPLFPEADDRQFADGYAQAVTFGLLMVRARGIGMGGALHAVSGQLKRTSSRIDTALQRLTDSPATHAALRVALDSLTRVLAVVDWQRLSKGDNDAWLYFYKEFLEVHDEDQRRKTGSSCTPPEVVQSMVNLVDEALRGPGFGLQRGLAAPAVTIADPAAGTGTYVLGVLRRIAQVVSADAMPDAIEHDAAAQRLRVGRGWIEPVPPAGCRHEVSGKQVLVRWFSYRRRTRTHPVIGDRRPPSPLGDIQHAGWPAE